MTLKTSASYSGLSPTSPVTPIEPFSFNIETIRQSFIKIDTILLLKGYRKLNHISDTLQGSIFTAEIIQNENEKITKNSKNSLVVIKQTSKELHAKQLAKSDLQNGEQRTVTEDILKEANILRTITEKMPSNSIFANSVVKYYNFFETATDYYLVMEYGGTPLFDFIVTVHKKIIDKEIHIKKWRKFCKYLLWQMSLFLYWLHSVNICHFDISLENILVINAKLMVDTSDPGYYTINKNISVKFCDFGLAEMFVHNKNKNANLKQAKNVFPSAKQSNSSEKHSKNAFSSEKHSNSSEKHSNTSEKLSNSSKNHSNSSEKHSNSNEKQSESIFSSKKHCGKLGYLSPQIAEFQPQFLADKCDVWSLGIVFMTMAIGSMPYAVPDIKEDRCYEYLINGKMGILFKQWKCFSYLSNDMFNLMKHMLNYNENQRYSMLDVIHHKWFRNYYNVFKSGMCDQN